MHNTLITGRYCYNGHLKRKWLPAIKMAIAFELVCWFCHQVHAADRLIVRLSGTEANGPISALPIVTVPACAKAQCIDLVMPSY